MQQLPLLHVTEKSFQFIFFSSISISCISPVDLPCICFCEKLACPTICIELRDASSCLQYMRFVTSSFGILKHLESNIAPVSQALSRTLIYLGSSVPSSLTACLHSSHKNRIKRSLKIPCICMKCLAVYSYRNRTTSHKLCLRYLLIKILHSGTTATSFLPNLSYISSRSYLSNLPHIHLLICPSLYHIRLIGYEPVV